MTSISLCFKNGCMRCELSAVLLGHRTGIKRYLVCFNMTIRQKSKIKLKAHGNCKSVDRVYTLLMLSYFDNIIQVVTGLCSIKHLFSENKCHLLSNMIHHRRRRSAHRREQTSLHLSLWCTRCSESHEPSNHGNSLIVRG